MRQHTPLTSRRAVVVGATVVTAASLLTARADTADLERSLTELTRGTTPNSSRVKLTLPELAENGNVVSLLVEVESPMTATDHVKTITILSEKNPQTTLIRFHLGPRAGRARVASNIRLASTQRVVALAEMSDGSFWSGDANVIVTLAACVDGG
jgi:sulfur-oxidizing protein SoxY